MRALLFTGGIFHDFDRMAAAAAGILSTTGLAVEIVTQPSELVAGLARGRADLVVVQGLRWRMLGNEKYDPFRAEWGYAVGADLKDALTGHAAHGGGILSLHTGCISFDDWPGWHDLIGGGWVWGQSFHVPGVEPVHVHTVKEHAVTAGVKPFTVTDEHYRALAIDPQAVVLAEGTASAGDSYPVAWALGRAGEHGRSVTITTGHDVASITEPNHARLLRQAAQWAMGCDKGKAA
ncbi:ThuA domain-containing protein [uncultured Alsobacter sp.]|uniref:ThuA domain-containing protein n=1 Tax=uncultured Alsobacter sp. TaxID=1748258 RepID=UPI0025CC8700|nr:ThuA domain-containing protein [uncultured Alsobacter sp.]